jgi:glycosyltransferase involved in cell wall biosynthesis
MKPRILFFITEDWYFWSHRLPLARAARDAGFEVVVATRVHKHSERIKREGFRLIPINLIRRNKKIFKEIFSILEIIKIYRREKPDIVHHVALKPVLYGSWAAKITNISGIVNTFPGLGVIFVAQGWKASIIRWLIIFAYRSTFSSKNAIGIFQNPTDLNLFIHAGVVKAKAAVLIRGSGVDTSRFIHLPQSSNIPTIMLASRMLWHKGIGDFINSARQLRKERVKSRFVLVGAPDPENPASIPEQTLRNWNLEGIVEWWGYRDDMPKVLMEAHVVALPTTYGEGVPKVLIEAASCGRPIVATNVPGCSEIVRHNENGLLVPPNDSKSLADAFKILIKDPELREKMGRRGREIVEAEFSEEIVVRNTMEVYKDIILTQRHKDARKKQDRKEGQILEFIDNGAEE